MVRNGQAVGLQPWRGPSAGPKENGHETEVSDPSLSDPSLSDLALSPDEPRSEPLPDIPPLLPPDHGRKRSSMLRRQQSLVVLTGGTHARTRAHAHTHSHTRTHAHARALTHARTHTHTLRRVWCSVLCTQWIVNSMHCSSDALGGALQHLLSVTCNIVLVPSSQPAFMCHSVTKLSYIIILYNKHNS